MPFKNPADQKAWLRKRIDEGYGRAIYQRRKQHLENERILREAALEALGLLVDARAEKSAAKQSRLYAKAQAALARGLDAAPAVVRTPMSLVAAMQDVEPPRARHPGGPQRPRKGGKR